MNNQKVLVEENNKVLTLTINRPQARNALDFETYEALAQALDSTHGRDDLHAVILTGAENYFTAGNDLRDFQKTPGATSPGITFLESLHKVEIPIIAAVEGGAVGIGVTMLMHCDFVYASDNVFFQIPFVPLGLCPEGASSVLMAQYVGIRTANEWLYRGKPFTAKEAQEKGFISAVSPAGQALSTAQELANEMAQQSLLSLKTTKQLLKRHMAPIIEETFKVERESFVQCLQSPQAQAAFAKFLTK
ncbi:MAG: enoyl-CoA hydratase-related protein [Pelistega sp.]|nr:enoyl-CoA hydratase-related protein [Pelistega sp.]